jgi:hypothetical protein
VMNDELGFEGIHANGGPFLGWKDHIAIVLILTSVTRI